MIVIRDTAKITSTEAETIVKNGRGGPCNSVCIRGKQYRAAEVRHSRLSWSARVLGEILDTTPAYLAVVESKGALFAVVEVVEEKTYVMAYMSSGGELKFNCLKSTSPDEVSRVFYQINPKGKLIKVYTLNMARELAEQIWRYTNES